MSENSDSLVIVVSEETGQISVAMNGTLTRDYTHDKLKTLLEEELYNNGNEIMLPGKKRFSLLKRGKKK